jgi:hypothetical protein
LAWRKQAARHRGETCKDEAGSKDAVDFHLLYLRSQMRSARMISPPLTKQFVCTLLPARAPGKVRAGGSGTRKGREFIDFDPSFSYNEINPARSQNTESEQFRKTGRLEVRPSM